MGDVVQFRPRPRQVDPKNAVPRFMRLCLEHDWRDPAKVEFAMHDFEERCRQIWGGRATPLVLALLIIAELEGELYEARRK